MDEEREALLKAMTDLVLAGGYEGASVAAICARAGIDPEVFHLHFADPAECFMAVYLRNNEEFGRPDLRCLH